MSALVLQYSLTGPEYDGKRGRVPASDIVIRYSEPTNLGTKPRAHAGGPLVRAYNGVRVVQDSSW
jgi:hypothetical protein